MKINYVNVNLAMAKEVGQGPALLFGVIYYVCQLPNKRVTASQETLAGLLGASPRSIYAWSLKLAEADYIEITGGPVTNNISLHPDIEVRDVFEVKRKRKKSKPKTPPEVEVVRELYNRYPAKKYWDEIISCFQGKTPEYVQGVHKLWCSQKTKAGPLYNPTNPGWFQWVKNGPPDGMAVNAKPAAPVVPVVAVSTDDDEELW